MGHTALSLLQPLRVEDADSDSDLSFQANVSESWGPGTSSRSCQSPCTWGILCRVRSSGSFHPGAPSPASPLPRSHGFGEKMPHHSPALAMSPPRPPAPFTASPASGPVTLPRVFKCLRLAQGPASPYWPHLVPASHLRCLHRGRTVCWPPELHMSRRRGSFSDRTSF